MIYVKPVLLFPKPSSASSSRSTAHLFVSRFSTFAPIRGSMSSPEATHNARRVIECATIERLTIREYRNTFRMCALYTMLYQTCGVFSYNADDDEDGSRRRTYLYC